MPIPLNDLQAEFQSIKPEVMAAIEGVLDTMQLFLGPQNQRFEQSFASYCGCDYGISVSNGTPVAFAANSMVNGSRLLRKSSSYWARIAGL